MSVLSDRDIIQRLGRNIDEDNIIISPCDVEYDVQPSSVDLHLGDEIKSMTGALLMDLNDHDSYILEPNEFILASTYEYIGVPNDLVGLVDGKSSLGRLGITAHITAGWIDPGFKGNITLEIKNVSNKAFKLYYKMDICQIIFITLSSPSEKPYGHEDRMNHYQYSKGTKPSYHMKKEPYATMVKK